MSQFAIAAAVVVVALLAWDVARRYLALQSRQVTSQDEFADLETRLRSELARLDAAVDKLQEQGDENESKLSRIVTQVSTTRAARQRMRLGGMG